ncbi:calcium-independent protein kinase C-like [Sycon ciliatum]|uniref:calcium-independent protein kinase C-like n=1 Tax=Sycon ciliatum TaxID=27933 RepID=UPI0031F71061
MSSVKNLVTFPALSEVTDAAVRSPMERDTQKASDGDESHGNGIEAFNLLKTLGKGSYGTVYLAEKKKNKDQVYAIKVLQKDTAIQKNIVSRTISEKKVLAIAGRHMFCAKMFECFQTASRLFFVMEYIGGGDLWFHSGKERSRRFGESTTRFYSAQIACALLHLHRSGIIHRDLKLENVMLSSDGHIKITDFGGSKVTLGATTSTFVGTTEYMAPEMVRRTAYNASVDWWALGVLMFEMMFGCVPFRGATTEVIFRNIKAQPVIFPDTNCSKHCESVLLSLMHKTVKQRLGCTAGSQVQTHPFFESIRWEALERGDINPPFIPPFDSKTDTSNFDTEFTDEVAVLEPIDERIVARIDQSKFRDFAFSITFPGAKLG